MKELYPTLVALFGTISAISVAYLVLLHEQARKGIDTSRKWLAFEITSALQCKNKSHGALSESDKIREEMLDNCRHGSVTVEDAEELLTVLKEKVSELRNDQIETVSAEVAGTRAKAAVHIDKYHIQDIEKVLARFKKAEAFYKEFPEHSQFAIGVPLVICAYFIVVVYFGGVGTGGFGFMNLVVALGGLYFVFYNTSETLGKLSGKPTKSESEDDSK